MSWLLFVSQATLDAWLERDRVQLDGDVMAVAGDARRFALTPAVRFLAVVGSDSDPHGLVGKVKRDAKVRELGAEALADSVVLGDVAYQVEPGFLADALGQAASGPTARRPGGAVDGDPMARFLLENLT